MPCNDKRITCQVPATFFPPLSLLLPSTFSHTSLPIPSSSLLLPFSYPFLPFFIYFRTFFSICVLQDISLSQRTRDRPHFFTDTSETQQLTEHMLYYNRHKPTKNTKKVADKQIDIRPHSYSDASVAVADLFLENSDDKELDAITLASTDW